MPIAARPLPPVDYLRECFDYDPDTGVLRWRVRPAEHFKTMKAMKIWNTRRAGDAAGAKDERGYLRVQVNHQLYWVHRIVWLLVLGVAPKGEIDHINENKADNRVCNLREANKASNMQNRGAQRNNTSGFKGVSYHKQRGKWTARIAVDGEQTYLGLFTTKAEAHTVYCAAADKLHGAFANHG